MRTEASGSGNKVAERLPNNGMHPTANSAAFIARLALILRFVAAGDAGRSVASH
jgi:hypothetical protein